MDLAPNAWHAVVLLHGLNDYRDGGGGAAGRSTCLRTSADDYLIPFKTRPMGIAEVQALKTELAATKRERDELQQTLAKVRRVMNE